MDARNLKTEQESRYVSYRDLGEFNTISDIRKLRGIICKTPKSDPCFTCTVMGRKMFILTHSYQTIATATTHDKIRFAIETEENVFYSTASRSTFSLSDSKSNSISKTETICS